MGRKRGRGRKRGGTRAGRAGKAKSGNRWIQQAVKRPGRVRRYLRTVYGNKAFTKTGEKRKDMDLDLYSDLLIDASLHGVKTFILSGGEPLTHRRFPELLDAYRLYYGSLAMATNGTLIPEYVDLFTPEDKGIQISLDGDEEFHDWLRGDGVYSAAIQAIEELREHSITPSIAFTVARENLHTAHHIIELCRKYGIRHVNVNMFMPLTSSELTPVTVDEFQRVRVEFERHGLRVSEPCYLKHCVAGIEVLSVLPDGTFWDCSRSQILLGRSIEEARLWEFVAENKKRESCIKAKPNNLLNLLKDKMEFPRSVDAVRYVDRLIGPIGELVTGKPFFAQIIAHVASQRQQVLRASPLDGDH